MSSYELKIGLRYTRAKRKNHFISFISLISMLGMALGIATLIIVLSVMNGFQTELRSRILAVVSHVEIKAFEGEMPNWQNVIDEVSTDKRVKGAAPYVQAQGMLSFNQTVRGVMVRGVLPNFEEKVADFKNHMKSGSFDSLSADSFNIVLGRELANALSVNTGDKITLIAPQGVVTPAGILPRLRSFTVSGIFEVGMFEYDSGLALIHLEDAQKLYRQNGASGVRLKLDDLFNAPKVVRDLAKTLQTPAYLSDWTQSHANFFRAVQIEKNMMFIILSLIVAVAAFNIVSTLVMAVTDKQADIAILRTLGASPKSIMKIFIIQGAMIGISGLVLGILGGIAIALNLDSIVPVIEKILGTELFSHEVYFLSSLPSELQWSDVLLISVNSFVLTLIVTLYPDIK